MKKTKKCTICYQVKSEKEFYLSKGKRDPRCKECLRKEQRIRYREKYPDSVWTEKEKKLIIKKKIEEKNKKIPDEQKLIICSICGESKLQEEFYLIYKNLNKRDSRCKECLRKWQREIYRRRHLNTKAKKAHKETQRKKKIETQIAKRLAKKREIRIRKLKKEAKKTLKKSDQRRWAYATRVSHREKYVIKISIDELAKKALQTTHCPLCDIELNYERNRGRAYPDTPSWDRIDNNIIMNAKTTQILCTKCNTTKSNRTMKQFIAYCTKIANKYKGD